MSFVNHTPKKNQIIKPTIIFPIAVIGIGNILLKDEGVGCHAIKKLTAYPLPPICELIDGGTAGADLLDIIADRKKVIIIDAVSYPYPPGTILRFSPDDLKPQDQQMMSLHDFNLGHTLQMADTLNCLPHEVVIFGIVPQDISPGLELTPVVASILPQLMQVIIKEIDFAS